MRGKGRRGGWFFWLGVGALVPLLYLVSFAPNGGSLEALGCSGAGPDLRSGVTAVQRLSSPVKVDTTGFVAFEIQALNVTPKEALAAVTIEVSDDAGEPVPGTTRILDREPGDTGEPERLWIAWEADEPLELDETLALHIGAENSEEPVTMTGSLFVAGARAELPEPALSFHFWEYVSFDTGPLEYCECSSFGSVRSIRDEARLQIDQDAPEVAVAWKYSVTGLPGKTGLASEPAVHLTTAGAGAPLKIALEFQGTSAEQCVQVTARDLRDDTTHTAELCEAPVPFIEAFTEDAILNCSLESVPEEYKQRWCDAPAHWELEECEPYLNPAPEPPASTGGVSSGGSSTAGGSTVGGSSVAGGGAPTGGKAPTGGRAPTSPMTAGNGGEPGETDDTIQAATKTTSSCSVNGATTPEPAAVRFAGLGLLALVVLRRCARRRR
jgi:hypothetical protein